METTDEINEKLFNNFRDGGSVKGYLRRLIERGGAKNITEAFELIADQGMDGSLMEYLVRLERYEDAAWLKQLCDIVRERLYDGEQGQLGAAA